MADAPIIIDIEASGFSVEGYPIEVGVAFEDGSTFCSLIAPPPEWTYWDEAAEKIHRVARDILEEYGRPAGDVAAELNERLDGKTAYSDGWAVDKPWLTALYGQVRMEPTYRLSSLEMILSQEQMEAWHETKDRVLAGFEKNRHRASKDARVIQDTWVETHNLALAP